VPDGSACDVDEDCISDDCRPFYEDGDGDGYGAELTGFVRICGDTPPNGDWVTNDDDCCDSDVEAKPTYNSGPRDYETGCDHYDWDCDGDETKSIAAPGTQGCLSYTTEATCPFSAFDADTACGDDGTADLCAWDGSTCLNVRGGIQTQTCE
jgi:hypothetical protein